MPTGDRMTRAPLARVWMQIGAAIFIGALVGSASVVPALRPLHALQSLIYFAVIYGARRARPWAIGAGLVVPTIWNALQIFITHLSQAGVRELGSLLSTGHARRLDTLFVPLGTLGHSVLIVASLVQLVQLEPSKREWTQVAAGAVVSLAYFALIVAIARPR